MALISCPECGHKVSTGAAACPGCGCAPSAADASEQVPPQPAQAPKERPKSDAVKLLGAGCLVVIVPLVVLVAFMLSSGDENRSSTRSGSAASPGKSETQQQQQRQRQQQQLSFIKESCLDLATQFGAQSKLSDLQKEELWRRYKGKSFTWQLQVTEVSSDTFGGYTVQYKCAPQSPSLIQDVQLKYADNAKAFVMKLQKGASYEVKGKLGNSSTLLGMTGDGIL